MEKTSCAPGSEWDPLVNFCVSHDSQGLTPKAVPRPVLRPVSSTRGPGESWSIISPSVWICVGLVVSGSVLVLLFWFIIYRRHRRTSQNTGEKDNTPHTPTTIQQEEEVLPPWPQFNGLPQETPVSERHCGQSLCNGRIVCNGQLEHGLPLPATELGDSALVTAKTGQPVEV